MTHADRLPWVEARARAAAAGRLLSSEDVSLEDGLGRVLRADLTATLDIPHYASAAMDGWAVAGDGPWKLVSGFPLRPGLAIPIVTGGAFPVSGDRVIRSELAHVVDGLLVADQAESRDHVRPAAEEAQAGEVLVTAGTRLSPAHLALAAAATVDQLTVAVRPRVGFVFTGDEVVLSGVPAAGQVRDSFGVTLPAILAALGAQIGGSLRIGDVRDATMAALRDTDADLIVTTGGTGGSAADHLRRALEELDAKLLVAGIAARPGGPTLLGRLPDGKLVLGLAGNPLAAMLGLLSLIDPLLAGFTGRVLPEPPVIPVPDSVRRHPELTRLVPVRATLEEVTWTGSAMMRGLAAADAVLVVPPEGDATVIRLPWG
ncbi:MAG: molybdopterin molybdotransferase MoeA [Pseudolysinimonas sp.]|uniref:molybdopterin molybdotransferase MoeA n=1 Tax=Pseudolysinimonas sp. TaxID=2680009 RepID=UPI00326714C6